jgi:hypothetical protein
MRCAPFDLPSTLNHSERNLALGDYPDQVLHPPGPIP